MLFEDIRYEGGAMRQYSISLFMVSIIVLGGMVLYGCGSSNYDSFCNTDPVFHLDKDEYSIGDTIRLTLELHGESNVRFYENIENTLDIWLAFRVPYQVEHTALSYVGIHSEEVELRDQGNIETYRFKIGRPLILNFYGRIRETKDKNAFLIVFSSLNKRFIVQKKEYANALSLEIHGHLTPINPDPRDSLEDYVGGVKLSIQS
jgi:hypothetical protein